MVNEDINQVFNEVKSEIFRDLRVCTLAFVVNVHDKQVDVQPSVSDLVAGVPVLPPIVRNLFVVGSSMPEVNALGVILHFDRKNYLVEGFQNSGGVAHEINYGVFLPIVQ